MSSGGADNKRAHGRSLADFRIETATTPHGLLPAEERLLVAAARGEGCRVSNLDWKIPEDLVMLASGHDWRLRARFLRFLALGGDCTTPVHEKGLEIEQAYIEGDLDLDCCECVSQLNVIDSYFADSVVLLDAHLKGLNLTGSRVVAIAGDRTTIDGSVLLRHGFKAEGSVRFISATIGANLDCGDGRLCRAGHPALMLDNAKVMGSVLLNRGLVVEGTVRLLGAEIGSTLECDGGTFVNPSGDALHFDRLTLKGGLFLRRDFTAKGIISLAGARVGYLVDDEKTARSTDCEYVLDGFVYDHIAGPTDANVRLAWLRRQLPRHLSSDHFRPQPFEQLFKVLADMGHDADARLVAMEKQRLMIPGRVRQVTWLLRPFVCLLLQLHRLTSGYGYKPGRLILILLGLWLAGGMFYNQAARGGAFAPADVRIRTASELIDKCGANWTRCRALQLGPFRPLVYSLDNVLPAIDLGQRKAWIPLNRSFWLVPGVLRFPGRWVATFVSTQNVLGYVGALLFGAIVTGLIKKD